MSITVDIDPADGPVYVQWLSETFETGTLSSYSAQDITDVVTGRARLDFHVPDAGYNCLVMYRDPKDGVHDLATADRAGEPFAVFDRTGRRAETIPAAVKMQDHRSVVRRACPSSCAPSKSSARSRSSSSWLASSSRRASMSRLVSTRTSPASAATCRPRSKISSCARRGRENVPLAHAGLLNVPLQV